MSNGFIFFTDPHYYLNPSKSLVAFDGLTSWFHTQIKITNQIFEYARKHEVTDIVVGGDIFEEKNRIPSILYNAVWDKYFEMSNKFNIFFNIGNHDLFTVTGKTSLRPFSNIVKVCDRRDIWEVGGVPVLFIPFHFPVS